MELLPVLLAERVKRNQKIYQLYKGCLIQDKQ